jgi:hypothetical protein
LIEEIITKTPHKQKSSEVITPSPKKIIIFNRTFESSIKEDENDLEDIEVPP